LKGEKIIVHVERVVNLGNYRSLRLGGDVEISLGPDDGAMDSFVEAEKQLLRRVNDIADEIESQIHK